MSMQQKIEAAKRRIQAFKADEEDEMANVVKEVMITLDPSLRYKTVVSAYATHVIWDWDDTVIGHDAIETDKLMYDLGFKKINTGSSELLKYNSNRWGVTLCPDLATLAIISL